MVHQVTTTPAEGTSASVKQDDDTAYLEREFDLGLPLLPGEYVIRKPLNRG